MRDKLSHRARAIQKERRCRFETILSFFYFALDSSVPFKPGTSGNVLIYVVIYCKTRVVAKDKYEYNVTMKLKSDWSSFFRKFGGFIVISILACPLFSNFFRAIQPSKLMPPNQKTPVIEFKCPPNY